MKYGLVLVLTFVFVLGWLASTVLSDVQVNNDADYLVYTITSGKEKPSPSDWVKSEQIRIYDNRIVIEIPNAVYAEFADTNSMDPVLDAGTNGIEIKPESPDDIQVGDIIAYRADVGVIIHRVVEKGIDSEGIYFITKGDNNRQADPQKIRFEQVERVLVALIY